MISLTIKINVLNILFLQSTTSTYFACTAKHRHNFVKFSLTSTLFPKLLLPYLREKLWKGFRLEKFADVSFCGRVPRLEQRNCVLTKVLPWRRREWQRQCVTSWTQVWFPVPCTARVDEGEKIRNEAEHRNKGELGRKVFEVLGLFLTILL